jgi:hypothetical protein
LIELPSPIAALMALKIVAQRLRARRQVGERHRRGCRLPAGIAIVGVHEILVVLPTPSTSLT